MSALGRTATVADRPHAVFEIRPSAHNSQRLKEKCQPKCAAGVARNPLSESRGGRGRSARLRRGSERGPERV